MPDRASDATGSTFQARVTGIRLEGSGPAQTYFTMSVTKVYASGASERLQAGRTIEVYSNPCDGFALVGIEEGDRILMSLLILHNGNAWRSSDHRIAQAQTIDAALALVVPGAPDTATASPKPAVDLSAFAFIASVVTVTLLILGARSERSTGLTPRR